MCTTDRDTVPALGNYLKLLASGELPDQLPVGLGFAEELSAVCALLRQYQEELEQLKLKLERETAYARVLQNSKQLYKDIFVNSVTGIMIVTEQGKILDANHAMEGMLGYGINELTRYNLSDISLPEDHDADNELINDLVEEIGRASCREIVLRYF